jgi:methyl-accepting chemotaxis protein
MRTLSLPRQLTLYIVVSATLTLLIGGGLYGLVRMAQKQGATLATDITHNTDAAYSIVTRAAALHGSGSDLLRLTDPDELEAAIAKLTKQHAELLTSLTAYSSDAALTTAYKKEIESTQKLIALVATGDLAKALDQQREAINPAHNAFMAALENANAIAQKQLTEEQAASTARINRSMRNGLFIAGVGLLALIGYGFIFRSRTVAQLRAVGESISSATERVAAQAAQVSSLSQGLSTDASSQAASVEETSASVAEIHSISESNKTQSQTAVRIAGEARIASDAGTQEIATLQAAMTEIHKACSGIGKIIRNIDEIAFQTNILALNAAVEAARAGEAGAGFAVVADEVRSLAQRSAASARETSALISESIAKSTRGTQLSQRALQSLKKINDLAHQSDSAIGQIATAINEQDQGIAQVTIALSHIDKTTQSGAAKAETGAATSNELKNQADELRESVNKLNQIIGQKPGTADPILPGCKNQELNPAAVAA